MHRWAWMIVVSVFLSGCVRGDVSDAEVSSMASVESTILAETLGIAESESIGMTRETMADVPEYLIDAGGSNLETRVKPPAGYARVPMAENSLGTYLRKMEMKEDQSPVLLYDKRNKGNQSAHAAVFSMPVFDSDLQQCADSIIRVYAEYLWSQGNYDKIAFHLTNGFLMEYSAWKDGNRLNVDGNHVSWQKKASYDDSYETFLLYLKYVMMYAGTLSLDEESDTIPLELLQVGDMFLKGGSPGHCVMISDIAQDEAGNKAFLLAQGYMPAQDFHILNNPLHEGDPWYYAAEVQYPFVTPEYVFSEGSLKRWYGFANTN